MLLKAPCKVKKVHLLTTQDEVSYFDWGNGRFFLTILLPFFSAVLSLFFPAGGQLPTEQRPGWNETKSQCLGHDSGCGVLLHYTWQRDKVQLQQMGGYINHLNKIILIKCTVFRFDNGWIIKIGRGLDYFKRPKVWLQQNHINTF